MTRQPRKHRAFLRALPANVYDDLLAAQGGVCGICGKPPKTRRLDRDHDHKTMTPRGLLCSVCNRRLKTVLTVAWLRAAADYLENPPAQRLREAA